MKKLVTYVSAGLAAIWIGTSIGISIKKIRNDVAAQVGYVDLTTDYTKNLLKQINYCNIEPEFQVEDIISSRLYNTSYIVGKSILFEDVMKHVHRSYELIIYDRDQNCRHLEVVDNNQDNNPDTFSIRRGNVLEDTDIQLSEREGKNAAHILYRNSRDIFGGDIEERYRFMKKQIKDSLK